MSKLVMNVSAQMRKNSAIVLLIWLAWCALVVVAGRLMVEDYMTSLLGYRAIPTRKTAENLAYFVALLPTLLQVAFGWWAIEKRAPLPTLIAIAALAVDVTTDIAYKVVAWTPAGVLIALAETFTLYTLGSEFLLMVSLENAAAYLPDAVAAGVILMSRVGEAFGHVMDWLSGRGGGPLPEHNGGIHHGGQQR